MKCKSSKYRMVGLRARQATGSGPGCSSGGGPVEELDGDAEMVDALENLPPNEEVELGMDAATAVASDFGNQNMVPEAASGAEKAAAVAADESWSPEMFHERLCVTELEQIDDVEKYYAGNFHVLSEECGVLLLLYTVLLTKVSASEEKQAMFERWVLNKVRFCFQGLESVNGEVSDTSEPLIHGTYGYGSQALINLMLTGYAVPYVWDNEQDVGGLSRFQFVREGSL